MVGLTAPRSYTAPSGDRTSWIELVAQKPIAVMERNQLCGQRTSQKHCALDDPSYAMLRLEVHGNLACRHPLVCVVLVTEPNCVSGTERTGVSDAKYLVLWSRAPTEEMRRPDHEIELYLDTEFLADLTMRRILKALALVNPSGDDFPLSAIDIDLVAAPENEISLRFSVVDQDRDRADESSVL